MKYSFTVRDLPKSERPRERLETFGPEALSAQELLALILGSGIKGESVMMTVQKLISGFGSLEGVMAASLEDLRSIKGVGIAKAAQIKSCFEVARRVDGKGEEKREKGAIKLGDSSRAVYQMVKSKISHYAREHFFVLSFDSRNQLLGIDTISVGTLNASLVHPREVFEAAIRRHAASIILAHNHPSGDQEPSQEDMEITKRLIQAGKILGIKVVDHLIITKTGFLSFLEKKLIN